MRKPCPICGPYYGDHVEVLDNRCVVVSSGATVPVIEAPTRVTIWCRECGCSTNPCATLADAELVWNGIPRSEVKEDDEIPF